MRQAELHCYWQTASMKVVKNQKNIFMAVSGNDLTNDRKQLGIHAVRGGTIPGEHTVIYAGADEIIELKNIPHYHGIFLPMVR